MTFTVDRTLATALTMTFSPLLAATTLFAGLIMLSDVLGLRWRQAGMCLSAG